MTDTLHTRLLAAVQQRMDVARAADGYSVFDGTGIVHGPVSAVVLPSHVATHIAANDPATVLRHCERDLKVLERHAPIENGPIGETICDYDGGAYPCPDAEDLAAAYGVDVDGG